MNISSEELIEILEKHSKWLRSDRDGVRANLSGLDLSGLDLSGLNLSKVNLSGANLSWTNLSGTNLSKANLFKANLSESNLTRANLYGANLTQAIIYNANLAQAILHNANLYGANLNEANLSKADLSGANLYDVNGNMFEIKTIKVDTYPVAYTDEVIQIGCENHKIEEWFKFSDKEILEMDGQQALRLWRKWKPILKKIILDEDRLNYEK